MWEAGGKNGIFFLIKRVNHSACEGDISEYLMIVKIDLFDKCHPDVMEEKKPFKLERAFRSEPLKKI